MTVTPWQAAESPLVKSSDPFAARGRMLGISSARWLFVLVDGGLLRALDGFFLRDLHLMQEGAGL